MQLEMPVEDYARGLEAIGAFDFRDQLRLVIAPTLVIAGAEDTATTPADAATIAQRIHGARLAVLAHAAHLANVEQASAFTEAVLEHLLPRSPRHWTSTWIPCTEAGPRIEKYLLAWAFSLPSGLPGVASG